jgi:hypothetical protein
MLWKIIRLSAAGFHYNLYLATGRSSNDPKQLKHLHTRELDPHVRAMDTTGCSAVDVCGLNTLDPRPRYFPRCKP